jgi:hypothetical protein
MTIPLDLPLREFSLSEVARMRGALAHLRSPQKRKRSGFTPFFPLRGAAGKTVPDLLDVAQETRQFASSATSSERRTMVPVAIHPRDSSIIRRSRKRVNHNPPDDNWGSYPPGPISFGGIARGDVIHGRMP